MRIWEKTCQAVERRYEARQTEREKRSQHLERLRQGGDWRQVDDPARFARRLMGLGMVDSALELAGAAPSTQPAPRRTLDVLERIIGKTNDLQSVDFLIRGYHVARAVARVVIRNGNGTIAGFGTGFMVSRRLVMTNNHVLDSAATATGSRLQFGFYQTRDGEIRPSIDFELRPADFFVTDPGLDFSIVAVAPRNADGIEVVTRGWAPLIGPSGKALVGERVNIIQHPEGGPQQVALRDNAIIDVFDNFLHYHSDTQQGSSGAPVFNDQWDLAALHHSGVPERDAARRILLRTGVPWDGSKATVPLISWKANEGIRISRIVDHLRGLAGTLTATKRQLLDELLSGQAPDFSKEHGIVGPTPSPGPSPSTLDTGPTPQIGGDGKVRWVLPLEVSVGLGGTGAPAPQVAPAPGESTPLPPEPSPLVSPPPAPPASGEVPLSEPVFEGITLQLEPDGGDDPKKRAKAVLRQALKEILDRTASTRLWSLEPVASIPFAFDLLPPEGYELPVKTAWDLVYALRDQEDVVQAEPSFEVLLDNLPDKDDLADAPELFRRAAEAEDAYGEEDFVPLAEAVAPPLPLIWNSGVVDWSPRFIEADLAWNIMPRPGGQARGAGIRVGHPDSGYRVHNELSDGTPNRVLTALEWDFIDNDPNAISRKGDHGLGTASVIMSGITGQIRGVAPEVEVVPLRVARKRILPAPVLLRGGMIRLRQAIEYATENDCHVISISLGGLPNKSLRKAIQEAVKKNVIVCAAAGNLVRFVVWPAHFPEVVAVAGCTAERRMWKGSSRGGAVDVTGPAKDVWKARIEKDGSQGIGQSSGTSFAVASTAGMAALWLAHHGRNNLINRYHGQFTLTDVFRRMLELSTDPPPMNHEGKFGVGIINARKMLEAEPPTLEEMRQLAPPAPEAAAAEPVPVPEAFAPFVEVLDSGPDDPHLRSNLSEMTRSPDHELEERLAGLSDELVFHVLTNPHLRERFLQLGEPSGEVGDLKEGLLVTAPRSFRAGSAMHDEILALEGLSGRLRERLSRE